MLDDIPTELIDDFLLAGVQAESCLPMDAHAILAMMQLIHKE